MKKASGEYIQAVGEDVLILVSEPVMMPNRPLPANLPTHLPPPTPSESAGSVSVARSDGPRPA